MKELIKTRTLGVIITLIGINILINSNGTSLIGSIITPIGMIELVFIPIYSLTIKKIFKW